MWNRRNDNETPARSTQPEVPSIPIKTTPTPVTVNKEPEQPVRKAAVVGSSMTIKGDIHSNEELYVDGEVEGKLELQHRLTVGPSGKVRASVKAKEVVVLGTIQGNVQAADKIVIRRSGSLVGDIKTAGIVIDDGAFFKGSIDIVKGAEAPRAVSAPASLAS